MFNLMKQADGGLHADIKFVGSTGRFFLVHSPVMATLSSKFNKIIAPMNISSMETPYLLELDFTDKAIVKLTELAYTDTTTPPCGGASADGRPVRHHQPQQDLQRLPSLYSVTWKLGAALQTRQEVVVQACPEGFAEVLVSELLISDQ